MKIPKKFKLLDSEYTVKVFDTGLLDGKWGMADYGRKEILIDQANKVPEEILFHEIAHMIAKHLELGELFADKDYEEVISNAYAAGFYSFFKNNPNIFK